MVIRLGLSAFVAASTVTVTIEMCSRLAPPSVIVGGVEVGGGMELCQRSAVSGRQLKLLTHL